MAQSITIAPRSIYGRLVADPVDAPAKLFADLVGQKTLTKDQLGIIKALGFEIVQVQQEGIVI